MKVYIRLCKEVGTRSATLLLSSNPWRMCSRRSRTQSPAMWLAFLLPNPDTLPKIRKAIIVHRIQRCMTWYLCSSIKYHQSTPQFRMFFVNDRYPYCRNSARNVSPHLFATFLSVRIPNCSFQYYLEGSSHKNRASIFPPTLQSSKYSPTCATETKREKSTKTFTSAINAA